MVTLAFNELRKVNRLECRTFEDMFKQVWNMSFNSCNYQRMDVVYDSYIKNSIKYSERQRRKTVNPILFYNLQTTLIIHNQIISFGLVTKTKKITTNVSTFLEEKIY